MATSANVQASKSYDLSGGALRESLTDMIFDLSPMDTIFVSSIKRGTAKSTTEEWLTDTLTAAAANANIEGVEFSAQARNLPTRLKNYTQISSKQIEVSRTAQKVNNAGMTTLLAYHVARAGKELKRDLEYNVLNNSPASAGTSTSPRVSGGVPNWIYSANHYKASTQTTQTTTAPVSGFATAAIGAIAASPTAYVEADLRDMIKLAWDNGGEIDTVLCDSVAFNKFSSFTGVAQRFRDVGSRQPAQMIGYADVYVSAYGTVKLQLSRYVPANTAYALQLDTWELAFLDPIQTVEIAKIGDSERRQLVCEWTLKAHQPKANAKAHGVA